MCNLGYGYPCCGFEIKRNSDKCKGCVHFDYYRDMGASTPICTLERDLGKAIQKANESECNEKITMQELINKAKAFDIIKTAFDITLDSKLRIFNQYDCVQTFLPVQKLPKGMSVDEAFEVLRKVLKVKEDD